MNEVFKVAVDGKDVRDAADIDLLVNSKYPFIKLDTANPASFQTIILTFNGDPPEPVLPAIGTSTVVYKLPHNYKYIPSFWGLVQVLSPIAATHFYQPYFQSSGVVSAYTASDSAAFTVFADDKNIYFQVDKFNLNDGLAQPNPLQGLVLQIRLYVFADDLGL